MATSLVLPSMSAVADSQGEAIVVTATRTARTVDETLAPVTIITRQDIERLQPQSVVDLFRGLPGVSFANNGGRGKQTSLFLRGTESDHVLVLIDGVKVGSATAGQAAFQDLPVDLIDRIEIVRGPRSSLYGSEAIGGVIQIFTRRGGQGFTPSFSIGAGTDHHYKGTASVSQRNDHGWISLSLSRELTDGFNSCRVEAAGVGGCYTAEPDRDGYDNNSGSLNAGYRFGGGTEVAFNWMKTDAESKFDGSYQNSAKSSQEVAGLKLSVKPFAPWTSSVSVGVSKDHANNYLNGVYASTFDTQRTTGTWQNDLMLGKAVTLTVGVDAQRDEIDSSTAYAERARDNTGVFALLQADVGVHELQLSVRRDDNEQFGRHTTGSVAWGMGLTPAIRLVASYATAFKAPTFNELYFPFYGKADLRPETSDTVELGLRGEHGWGRWTVNVFESDVEDLIAYDASIFLANNVDSARIQGAEATLATTLAGIDVRGSLTLLDTSNESDNAYQGNWLARRPAQSARLDLDRAIGPVRVGATVVAEGKRYDDLANEHRLGGYATLDLRAEYAFAPHWRVQATLGNVFDKAYETARFYRQQGRNVFLTLRYAPGR
ncbi:TonB-dependent vitamin B12 receptor [Nitrogeniibacter mangrovi]|uniref:TonB-dependent vitamin B12 receptor n=2 Tax=Nitrogeniibacter mangrovi TaxID=2016596 RepID=A0A6C1B7K9_9RHOO|nr:TonB-dependent vitamin B12 receptor [Nitrogeniibacter mangrovi]